MNKIGWCDMTWNPVWGCRNHCEYCYARIFANRFCRPTAKMEYKGYICSPSGEDGDPYDVMRWIDDLGERLRCFIPTFLEAKFRRKFPKRPQRIFVGSMSEIYYWQEEWMERVLEKVKLYPQHIFQFLTRYPEVYDRYIFPKNCWLGVTITKEKDFERGIPYLFITSCNITFVSVEPLLGPVDPRAFSNANIDWVIIGAETGNRKGKVIPNGSWIFNILDYCNKHDIPIYIKDNIVKYYSESGKYKQFPKEKDYATNAR